MTHADFAKAYTAAQGYVNSDWPRDIGLIARALVAVMDERRVVRDMMADAQHDLRAAADGLSAAMRSMPKVIEPTP